MFEMVGNVVKKDKCIVHVGMHKTGTSSIQNMLFNFLDDKRFSYANLGVRNQSGAIFCMFADEPEKYHANVSRGLSISEVNKNNAENMKILVNGFGRNGAAVEIISGEDIGKFSYRELSRFKEFLEQYFERINIIAYIRPPVSYMQSAFQELIKHGLKRFEIGLRDPEYERFRKIDDLFGEENVYFRPFSTSKIMNNDIVLDFCQTCGIRLSRKNYLARKNKAISREALSLLYVYQKMYDTSSVGRGHFRERNLLITALSKIGTGKIEFSEKLIKKILDRNKKGIEYLANRMGGGLEEDYSESHECIKSEDDFLKFGTGTVDALMDLIGNEFLPDRENNNTPENVARLVHAFHTKLKSEKSLS